MYKKKNSTLGACIFVILVIFVVFSSGCISFEEKKPKVPSAPQNLQANSGDEFVLLSWQAPKSDGGSAIKNYNIYRDGYLLGQVGTDVSYVDSNVENGVTYTYEVSAVNANGEGSVSNRVSATPQSPSVVPIWWNTWGGNGFDEATSIAVDSSNIYVAGETWSFGAGENDAFILKYGLNGNMLWYKTRGGSSYECAYSIAVDSSNIYVAGKTHSFGAGSADALILKYDLNGNLLWYKTWGGGSSYDRARSLAVDSSNIYVAGMTHGFGTVKADAFLLKYDLNGNLVWNKTWSRHDDDCAESIAVVSSNIYVVGHTDSFDGSETDAFILKYDLNGNMLWYKTWGGSDRDYAYSIAVDSSNIYVAGETYSFGAGASDAFILKCNLEGCGG
ncbi:MAG: fibronectin type III domain-containing protein [Candidatus Thermoplasmatota archaeon]